MVSEITANFKPGQGPIYAEEEVIVIPEVDEEAIFSQGFEDGFEKGQEQAKEDAVAAQVIDKDTLARYSERFEEWVDDREWSQNLFACDGEVDIRHPFPEDKSMYALFAAHDCVEYDLILQVTFDEAQVNNYIGHFGADFTEKECSRANYLNKGVVICEYKLLARGPNFGILLSGGYSPIAYSFKWAQS